MTARSARQADNLPEDLTSFVGRRAEIQAVRQLLSTGRLVTATGVGGVGKSRLALQVARDVRRAFPDGVALVELASVKDPSLLPHTVVDTLGIQNQAARSPLTVLADYLRPRQKLLVLDNCEHLLEAAADLVDRLLRVAPDLRILATSRQALMIAGEQLYPVPPLPVPDPEAPLAPGSGTQFASVGLFAERAAAVVPGFEVTPDNEAAVIRLCQRLEGIPLALELAAARLRVLTVAELAKRLDNRFESLGRGSRNLPERHQTLQALIDWSYDLCTPTEQALWERASVFAGGFGLDALDAVCTDESLPPDALLDTIAGLADKSIFIRGEQSGRVRFGMLETIREYGQIRLRDAGAEAGVRRRHRDWCHELVESAAEEWFGRGQEDWAALLRTEHANVRTALEYCLSTPGDAHVAVRMAGISWFHWIALGFMTEGRLWLDRALDVDQGPSHERAWALATDAYIAVFQGDQAAALTLLDSAHELAVQLGDPAALAYVKHLLGVHALSTDPATAIPLLVEAAERYASLDVPQDYPTSLRIHLTLAYLVSGDLDRGAEVVRQAYERCEQAGERWLLSYAMWAQGFLELLRGDFDDAEAHLRASLKIKRFLHDTLGLAFGLDVLAWITAAREDHGRAAVLLGAANQVWQTIGVQLFGAKHLVAQRQEFEQMVRVAIGNSAFDSAFARGGNLTAEEMVAFACGESRALVESRQAPTDLTPREREVADLVADGMSNKELAARLVLSVRTVEVHVAHILDKLGFNSRTQIATWVAQQRAAAGSPDRS